MWFFCHANFDKYVLMQEGTAVHSTLELSVSSLQCQYQPSNSNMVWKISLYFICILFFI